MLKGVGDKIPKYRSNEKSIDFVLKCYLCFSVSGAHIVCNDLNALGWEDVPVATLDDSLINF